MHLVVHWWEWRRIVITFKFTNFLTFLQTSIEPKFEIIDQCWLFRQIYLVWAHFLLWLARFSQSLNVFLFLFFAFILNQIFKWRPPRQAWEEKTTGKNIHIYSMSVKTWFLNANVERNMRASQGCICIFKENTGKKYRQNLILTSATLWSKTRKSPISTLWTKNAMRNWKIWL